MQKIKEKLSTVVIIMMLVVGILIMLYPTISNYINEKNASRVIEDYNKRYSQMSSDEYQRYLSKYQEYNEKLKLLDEVIFTNGDAESKEYIELLEMTEDEVMGYVEIEKLGVSLPIYFGTSETILQKSVGHLEGSSLPIGGEGNHSVIVGHSGIANAKIFTDLDQMEIGDTFAVTCLGKKMIYKVDNIVTILPEEIKYLQITEGKDYITLLTCTPYAVNTHRLLVRGIRIE